MSRLSLRCCSGASAILAGSIALLLASPKANAQTDYSTAGSEYSQNFDSLPSSATSLPATGVFSFTTNVGATSMAGWFGDASVANKYSVGPGTGSVTTGGFYGYSVAGAQPITDIALGMQTASGSGTEIFGLGLTNTTGGTLTSFTISYDAQTWHFGTATTSRTLAFGYNIGGATLPTISTTGTISPASGSYVADTALNYTVAGTGTAESVDGNAAGNYTLETATISGLDWTSGTTLWLTWDFGVDSSQSPGLAIDNLTFSALGGGSLPSNDVWNVINGVGTWDTTSGNWTGGSPTPNLFKTGDNVTFDDTHSGAPGGTVTIQAGGVSPGSTTVNTAGTYTFQNAGGDTNGISGSGSVTKLGTGTLVFTSPNTYTGGTVVDGGTLQISADNQLGGSGGSVNIDNATLSITASILGMNRSMTLGVDGETIATNGNSLANGGATAINGTVTTTGGGNVAFNGPVTFGATSGSLNIPAGGSVTLGQLTGTISFGNGSLINGSLNIGVANQSSATRVNFDNGGSSPGITGTGSINILSTGTLITNASSTTGDVVSANIALNSAGTAFTKGDVTQATYASGSFVTTIGGTTAGFGLTINSVISGASDVNFANATSGGGSGSLVLGGQSTYTGATTINIKNGTIQLGVNNALPVTTDLIYGTSTSASGAATLDLGGFNQQVDSLSTVTPLNTGGSFTILNGGEGSPTLSTLTVSGSITPANEFAGVISDGIYGIALAKGGSNTLALSGLNTYTGATTITGGTLLLDFSTATSPLTNILYGDGYNAGSDGFPGGGVVNIGGGGILNLTGGAGLVNSQQIYGLNVTAGGSTIFLNQNGATSLTLTLGAMTQAVGGTVNFSAIPAAAGVIATTTNPNANGILGTWATVGSGTTLAYATQTGVNSQIGAYAAGAAAATDAGLTDTTGTVNYNLASASGTTPATVSANTIRYTGTGGTTAPGATSFTVNGLMNAGTGLWTIGTNSITIGANGGNKELDIVSNSLGITISSAIKNNSGGASVITTSGTGTVTLSGANTYTGGTFINGGILNLGSAQNGTVSGPLGASGSIYFGGGTLQYSGANTTDYSSRFSAAANQPISIDTNSQTVTFGSPLTSAGGSLTKLGLGTLILSVANTYTAGTFVDGGTLQISANTQLGAATAPVTVDNATLLVNAGIPAMNRSLTVGVDGATIATNGSALVNSGATNINGTLTTNSGGNLDFNGGVSFGSNTNTSQYGSLNVVANSAVTLGQLSGTITFGNGSAINGNLNIGVAGQTTAVRVNFDNASVDSTGVYGSGNINILSSGTTITNASKTIGDTVSANIVLNSGGTAFTKGNVTQATYVPGTFITSIGGTTASQDVITINSVISGASDVNFGNSSTGGGSGELLLGGQSTYTGTTTFNTNAGTVELAVTNALPTTTDLIYGTSSAASGAAIFDLGGENQQIGSLSTVTPFNSGGSFTIANYGGFTGNASILTVSGSTTPYYDFGGIISDGFFGISLVKGGSNTLALSNANTYTGTTTITGGTLTLDFSAAGAPTSNILYNGYTSSLNPGGGVVNIGGGVLNLTGGSATTDSQQIYGLNVTAGGSTIVLNQNGATSLTLTLGAMTQTAGGTLNFSVVPLATGVIATTTNSNVNGILGTWANVGSGTALAYATQTGVNSQIGAYTAGTAAATAAGLTDTTGSVNYNLTSSSGTTPATVSANTIRYTGAAGTTAPGATSFTVNGLMNAGTGLWTIGTNAITIGANGGNDELDIVSNSQGIAISSVIKNNSGGPSIITASGTGTITLSGANTYTGGTFINGGILSLSVAQNGTVSGPMGASGPIYFGGGTLQYSSSNTTDYSSRFSAAPNQAASINTNGQNVTFSAALTSVGGSLNKTGAGDLTLAAANTYNGGTTVQQGALIVSGSITGSTQVQSGGQLGGLGTVGNVEVQSGGKLQPGLTTSGASLGTLTASNLTWDGGGTLLFELSTTNNTSDHLSLGTGVLSEGAAGQYLFDFLGGGKAGQTYTLINFGSTSFSSASAFTATDLAPGLTGDFTLTGSALDLTLLAVVPEPSSWAALAVGAGLLLGLRRFRRGARA